jgi:hypothetical protein
MMFRLMNISGGAEFIVFVIPYVNDAQAASRLFDKGCSSIAPFTVQTATADNRLVFSHFVGESWWAP